MSNRTAWRGRIARLIKDQSGATAVITGVTLLVIASLGFAAFDFTRANGSKTNLQDALDSAALAAARIKGDDEAAKKAGQDYLAAHLSPEEYKDLSVNFEITKDTVKATASAKVQPYFVHMFMGGPIKIATDSEVKRQIDGTLEIALVLDTTKSMDFDGKMAALKVAAKALVQQVNKVKDADVKLAVVPFANYVNIGVSRRNEPWADVPADWVEDVPAKEKKCTWITTKTTCDKVPTDCYVDGVLLKNGCTKNVNCKTENITPYESCTGPTGPSKTHHKFHGCVGSPAYPKNVTDNDPTRKYPGFLDQGCAKELTPLTSNHGHVISAIETLTAANNTYIPAGLAWGWNILSKPVPFTEAADYDANNKKPRKALVLMTDGANTMKMNPGGRHADAGATSPQADTYTKELCDNIKAEKIELYTVAFKIDVPSAHALLQQCATSPSHYYKADSAEELLKAFEAIGKSLENLRIAH